MNRKEASEFLGCSEKSVSRYVAAGRLPDVRKNGALDIGEADLQRLKGELETPVATARDNGTGQDITAIVPVSKGYGGKQGNTLAILDRVMSNGVGQRETGQVKPFVPTADKLLLSLEEASALTGLSSARLRVAIGEEKLVARRVGRGWKMRRGDVERFVNSIFEEDR